jgi:uncharacterized coiled-coil DUF342 family protein
MKLKEKIKEKLHFRGYMHNKIEKILEDPQIYHKTMKKIN